MPPHDAIRRSVCHQQSPRLRSSRVLTGKEAIDLLAPEREGARVCHSLCIRKIHSESVGSDLSLRLPASVGSLFNQEGKREDIKKKNWNPNRGTQLDIMLIHSILSNRAWAHRGEGSRHFYHEMLSPNLNNMPCQG